MVVQNVSALEKLNYVLLILLLNKHRYIYVCPRQPVRGVYRKLCRGGAQPFWTSQKGAKFHSKLEKIIFTFLGGLASLPFKHPLFSHVHSTTQLHSLSSKELNSRFKL